MPPSSKSIASFIDVEPALRKAIELGKLRLEFPSEKDATVWNARANAFRVLLRKENERMNKGHSSPFDALVIRKPAGEPAVRTIHYREVKFAAFGPDGEPLMLKPGQSVAESDAMEAFLADFEAKLPPIEGEA